MSIEEAARELISETGGWVMAKDVARRVYEHEPTSTETQTASRRLMKLYKVGVFDRYRKDYIATYVYGLPGMEPPEGVGAEPPRSRVMHVIQEWGDSHKDRGITIREIVSKAHVAAESLPGYLAALKRDGKILCLLVPGSMQSKPRYYYVPNNGRWADRADETVPVMNANLMAGRFNGIFKSEIDKARKRVRTGDVLPAIVDKVCDENHSYSEIIDDVVVAYKSRHLIMCTNGMTYPYATLAMHYRDNRPLGRWEM